MGLSKAIDLFELAAIVYGVKLWKICKFED